MGPFSLADTLGLPWDVVHAEAHRLEHATSDIVAERLAAFLEHPETCPHGFPVPGPGGEMAEVEGVYLSALESGSRGRFLRVIHETAPLLAHLKALGLVPGAEIEVRGVDPFDGALLAVIDGRQAALGRTVADNVIVEVIEEGDR